MQLSKSRRWPRQVTLHHSSEASSGNTLEQGAVWRWAWVGAKRKKKNKLECLDTKSTGYLRHSIRVSLPSKTDFLILVWFPVSQSIIQPSPMGLACHRHITVNCVISLWSNKTHQVSIPKNLRNSSDHKMDIASKTLQQQHRFQSVQKVTVSTFTSVTQ